MNGDHEKHQSAVDNNNQAHSLFLIQTEFKHVVFPIFVSYLLLPTDLKFLSFPFQSHY